VGAETGTITKVEWFEADTQDGTYASIGEVTDTSGVFSKALSSFTSAKWYKATVNDSIESKPVMIYGNYITNGAIGYRWYDSGTRLNMIGQYNSRWIETSYKKYWELKTSADANPGALSASSGSAILDQIYGSFFEDDVQTLAITADLGEGQTAFSFGTDVELNDNDGAPLTAVRRGDTITQIQIVDDYDSNYNHLGLSDQIPLTNAAFVIKLSGNPVSTAWLGRYSGRKHFSWNTNGSDIIYNVASQIDTSIAGNLQDTDSGMTASWTGLPAGGSVSFMVSIGTVSQTGASLTAELTEDIDKITVSDATSDNYYRILDADGNPLPAEKLAEIVVTDGEGNVLTPDENGWVHGADTGIVFNNLDSETTYTIQVITVATYEGLGENTGTVDDNDVTNVTGQTGIDPFNPKNDEDTDYTGTKVKKSMTKIQIAGDVAFTGTYKLYDEAGTLVDSCDVEEGKAEFTGLTPGTQYQISFTRTGKSESVKVPITTLIVTADSFDYAGTVLSPVIYDADTDSNLVVGTDYANNETASALNAGEYTFDFEGLTDVYGSEPGITWSIAKTDLAVTPKDQTITYGSQLSMKVADCTLDGIVGDDVFSSIKLTASGKDVTSSGTISASDLVIKNGSDTVTSNYNITYNTGKLVIAKAPLTITANDNTILYGEVAKNAGATYKGFVNGENESVLTGQLTYSFTDNAGAAYTKTSPNGKYHIVPSGLAAANYNITYVNGTLSVENKSDIALNAGLKISQTGSKITVKWGKVKDADGYEIYVAYCGKKFGKTAKTIKDNATTSATITKINGKKINLKKNFKLYVTAYKLVDGEKVQLAKTITGHVVGRKNTKYTNVKKITLESKSSVTVKVGKTSKIKAKTVLVDKKKKPLSDAHAKEFRYASSDKSIASVSSEGVITGKRAGTCTVYVYARNGYAKKIKVTVK